jgi:deferrochelatase/peroxidase EfeB
MPSGKKHSKHPGASKIDNVLANIGDESTAAAKKEFADLLAQAKGDTAALVQQNARELEERLVLFKERKIDKEDFDYFIANQKRDLRVFIDSQPAQSQERAEKLTLHLLAMAAEKILPLVIAAI